MSRIPLLALEPQAETWTKVAVDWQDEVDGDVGCQGAGYVDGDGEDIT